MNSPQLRDSDSWNVATSTPLLYSLVFGEELANMADERDDILVLTADLMTSNRTSDFASRHPDRFYNLGIAEQNMVSVAAGLSTCGYIPYISTFASFASLLCAEQLRTDLAYTKAQVRVIAHHAGISMGFYGTSHHAVEDIAITRSIPGMTVCSAADAAAIRAILRTTVDHDGPVYIRLGRGREREVYASLPDLPFGTFIQARDGTDVTVIATGIGVHAAVGAADALQADGLSVRVLDAAFLKPIDHGAILRAAAETQGILVVEEHSILGGLGGAVAEVLATNGISTRLMLHGIQDKYVLIAPPMHLYRYYGFTAEGIIERLRKLLA